MEKKKNYYNCFSYPLKKYLNALGFEEVNEHVHSKTGKTFWVFKTSHSFFIGLKAYTISKEMFNK